MVSLLALGLFATVQASDQGFVLKAGGDWVPLPMPLDVARGSVLDWAPRRPEPCGARGWLTVNSQGKFAFEKTPDREERFYGANLCFSAMFLEKTEAQRLARRLAAMGYNTVRLHHYDGELTNDVDPKDSTKISPEKLDRLDYLVSQLKRQGLYVAIDLYTIRRIRPGEVLSGETPMDEYKALLLVSEKARENWFRFASNLLKHKNPYTGLAWKDDPTIAWICVVNENNFGSAARSLSPEAKRLFDEAYRADGHSGEWQWGTQEGALWAARKHVEAYRWMRDRLRSIGVKALLTDNNGWYNQQALLLNRRQLDFVDDHFYWDHPRFLGDSWGLPSQGWQVGRSAIPEEGGGLRTMGLSRYAGKPFVCTELNFTAPNAHRIEGGLLGGAIAARQAWDGVWRFAWSHNAENVRRPQPINYFDVQADPLQQASERALVALFLKRHLPPAPAEAVVRLDPVEHAHWVYASPVVEQVFTRRYSTSADSGLEGDVPPSGTPAPVSVDRAKGTLTVASPQTCGVVGPQGNRLSAGPLEAELREAFAALWASSLTGKPLAETDRALLVYATDVQNTEMRYRAADRLVLEAWGKVPHLARRGSALVRLAVREPEKLEVYRLDMAGRRQAKLPARVAGGRLEFEVRISEDSPTFYYELLRR